MLEFFENNLTVSPVCSLFMQTQHHGSISKGHTPKFWLE